MKIQTTLPIHIPSKEEQLNKVIKLLDLFNKGAILTLQKREVKPELELNSRENYMYFTLPVSLNSQRSSPAMWESAFKTFDDPETNYLFYPEEVVKTRREKIQNDLTKHKLALQKNKHTDIWITLSNTLNKYYENNPRNIILENNSDVIEIIKNIRIKRKKDFPSERNKTLKLLAFYTS